jgi:hypothetical protein
LVGCSTDLEAGEAFWLFVLHGDVLDIRARRAALAPLDHLLHRVRIPLEDSLDLAILSVADPPAQAELLGLAPRRVAEGHALHTSRNENVCSFFVSHL